MTMAPTTFTGTGGTATWTRNLVTGQYEYTLAPASPTGQAPAAAGGPMQAVTGWEIILTDAQINKWAADAMNDRRRIDDAYVSDQQRFGLDVANTNWQRAMAVLQAKSQRLTYELDKQRLGMEVANSNRSARAQELTFKMQALQMLADRKGPQDWVAYNNLVNGLAAPTPEASQTIDVFGEIGKANLGEQIAVNLPAAPGDSEYAALSAPYAPPPPQTSSPGVGGGTPVGTPPPAGVPVTAPAATRTADSAGSYGGTPTGPVLGYDSSSRPIFGPDRAVPMAPVAQVAAPQPAPAPIPVSQPAPAPVTPPAPAMAPPAYSAPPAPIPVAPSTPAPVNSFGSVTNPFGSDADYRNYPGYEHGTGGYINATARVVGEEGPELEHNMVDPRTGQMMIRVIPLSEAEERRAQGMPGVRGMATGGTITVNQYDQATLGNQPFIQKIKGEREAPLFTGYGQSIDAPSVGVYGLPAVPSQQTLNRLLPSEQLMLQGTYEEAGQYWADILEKARRAAPAGRTLGPAFYGG